MFGANRCFIQKFRDYEVVSVHILVAGVLVDKIGYCSDVSVAGLVFTATFFAGRRRSIRGTD